MIENMHDRPYLKGAVGPEIVAAMTAIGREVRRAVSRFRWACRCWRGRTSRPWRWRTPAARRFVRAEGFVFAHVADEGHHRVQRGAAAPLPQGHRRRRRARVRRHQEEALGARDHRDVDLVETAHAAEFFLADGLIVTGVATGRAADAAEVRAVAESAGIPTLVGLRDHGRTTWPEYAAADAYIVGSWLKGDGQWTCPPDPARCDALRAAVDTLPRP